MSASDVGVRTNVRARTGVIRYVLSQLTGFTVNYLVFSGWVFFVALCAKWPVVAIGAGSLSGLVVNYTSAKLLVFQWSKDGKGSSS